MPIRNWAGLVLAAIGVWFFVTALKRRKRALAAWHEARAKGLEIDVRTSQKFALTGAIARPLVNFMLLLGAAEVSLSYAALGNTRLFSAIDLGGFLLLLLGYGVWFSISTRYREVVPVPVGPVPVVPVPVGPVTSAAEPG